MYNENNQNEFHQDTNGRQEQQPEMQQGRWQNEGRDSQQNYYERYRAGQNNYNGQNSYNGQNQWDNRGTSGRGSSRGPRIAIAVILAAVFVAFCVGVSWFAVDSIKDSVSTITESLREPETGVEEEAVEAVPEAKPESVQSVPTAPAAGQIQESAQVIAVVTDVTDVVEKVMPACVSITNMSTQQYQSFWGQTYSQDSESNGSGIIIGQNDTELLVVSNNHVVEDADTLYVQFIDGQSVPALVKGTDAAVDLAVLAVSLADISDETKAAICVAQMGDSDKLKIGEPAIAIGNALGYGQSVTTGVISALNRTLEVSEKGNSNALIQTDAAINPGNSGGALLNIHGQVVGINSSKIGDSLVEGMGYAIPISTAKPIIEDLMSKETKVKVSEDERGYLGISCINVDSETASTYNMPEGVFVAQVYEGTGADKAGLVRGDIITAFDGTEIKNQTELMALTQYYKAGETVEITIMQGSANGYQPKTVMLTLSTVEELNAASETPSEARPQTRPSYRLP